jgi:hypothetical protein
MMTVGIWKRRYHIMVLYCSKELLVYPGTSKQRLRVSWSSRWVVDMVGAEDGVNVCLLWGQVCPLKLIFVLPLRAVNGQLGRKASNVLNNYEC